MKNSNDALLREYARKLTDEDLKYLYLRCSQLLCSDRAEVADCVCNHREIDKWLQTAESSMEFFEMLDYLGDFIKKEHVRRFEKSKEERRNRD